MIFHVFKKNHGKGRVSRTYYGKYQCDGMSRAITLNLGVTEKRMAEKKLQILFDEAQNETNGIWKELEQKCETMADKYGKVWIITGPVFFNKTPSMWLGSNTEKQAAIPDAFFKIIIWQEGDKVVHQAFLIPNILIKPKPLKSYQTTIPRIESLTGLKFLTNISKL